MKNDLFTPLLVLTVSIGVVVAAALSVIAVLRMRKLQTLQAQVMQIEKNHYRINGLANEALAYSKTNPAITRILNEFTNRNVNAPKAAAK